MNPLDQHLPAIEKWLDACLDRVLDFMKREGLCTEEEAKHVKLTYTVPDSMKRKGTGKI